MTYFILWYLTLSLFALAALPLGWSWFRHLPDRGWGLLRPLGLLLVGFTVWFLGNFGFLRLNAGSGFGALVLLLIVGGWVLQHWGGGWEALRAWVQEHRMLLLVEEGLFLLLFAFWSWYRIHESYGIGHTEQPMDFALMNAILRGGEVPPNDPWLSGFAISYYYLGYFIMAQVTAMSGVISGVAYNLALTSLAAMAGTGAFSLVYNLVWDEVNERVRRPALTIALALLGPLFLLGISNLTGLLTMLYHEGQGSPALYNWLAVNDLTVDTATGARLPKGGWWWWNASRTLSDYDPAGNRIEVIDEFPFFSFMLGDMHPHVLALPFVLLGVTIALNALRGALRPTLVQRWRAATLPPEGWMVSPGFAKLTLLLTMIFLGGASMMNTWDYPTMLTLFAGVWLIASLVGKREERWTQTLLGWLGGVGLLLLGALLLYLPFYISFSSQAEGIRFSPFATAPQHYLLMFGLFWLVLIPLLLSQLGFINEVLREVSTRLIALSAGMLLLDGMLLYFLLNSGIDEARLAFVLAGLWLLLPLTLATLVRQEEPTLLFIAQIAGLPLLGGLATQRWTMALVALALVLALLALWARVRTLLPTIEVALSTRSVRRQPAIAGGDAATIPELPVLSTMQRDSSLIFALGLTALALLLTMGSEIFYIKDGFPGRMNTIFKLYYQGWTLMALASAFGLFYLSRRLPMALRVPWLLLVTLLTVGSLWYPASALQSKADFNSPANWDGRFWMERNDVNRFAAIQWLDTLPEQVVILEKPGGSYQAGDSALAGWTGHSTLVGWSGHELQWRGTYDEVGRREPIIAQIYQSTDAEQARQLVEEWDIDYVALTPAEITHYQLSGPQIDKFYKFMTPAFQQGEI
nr:hypothetical protein [Ardenticatenales bacterium]